MNCGYSSLKASFLFILCFIFSLTSYAVEKGVVKGRIVDKKSKEPIPGVTISVEGTDVIVFSDEDGRYEINLPEGTYILRAELLGFKPAQAENVVVLPEKSITINLELEEAAAVMGEEYVVTGERLNVPLSKTTATVAVVSSKDIEKIPSVSTAADLLTNTPGVQMESGSSLMTKIIKIRGRTVAPPRTASSGILLLIDGIPANDPLSGYANLYQIPPENIERIEVLKGASSAQYGGQAAAGVINIITKKGQKKPVTSANASFSTYQRRRGAEREFYENYSFSHSWGNKYFDYSLSGSYAHSSGVTSADKNKVGNAFVLFAKKNPGKGRLPDGTKILSNRKEIPFMLGKNINELADVGDHDKSERYSISLNLGINLFEGNTLRVNPGYSLVTFYSIFSPGNIALTSAKDTFLQSLLHIFNRRDWLNVSDKWEITPNVTYNMRLGLLKSTSTASFIFVNDFIDYNLEEEAQGAKDGFRGGDGPFTPSPDTSINRAFNFANDLTFKFDLLDGDTLTVGQEYRWTKSSTATQSYVTPSVKRNIHSLFFQNLLTFKKLTFSVGGRWDQATTFIEDFDDEFSPRLGLNYEFKPGTSLRFSVGRARRFPEFAHKFGLAQANGRSYGNPLLGPEINWTYELGFRFTTKYISGDIAYFYDDYSDFEIAQNVTFIGFSDGGEYAEKVLGVSPARQAELTEKFNKNFTQTRSTFFINGPDVVFQGFDTSFDINPIENLNITVSYLFQRAVIGNNNPFDFSQGTPQKLLRAPDGRPVGPEFAHDNRLVYVPTHILKLGGSYTFPFGLNININGRFKSTTKFVTALYPGGLLTQPEHWIWDYKMSQPLFSGKIKLTFAIENVFSKFYYENGGIPSNVARYVIGVESRF
ncbi:MAG: TonB-dependent receptor [Candidatus Schekmanbacteria bacterium]|nr:MAG: TonB-dependent receptor [Candidatus Schekmanbacteria bacterium]